MKTRNCYTLLSICLGLLLAAALLLGARPAAALPGADGPTTGFDSGSDAAVSQSAVRAAAAPAALPPGWDYACPDCLYQTAYTNNHNLRVDSQGHLHLAFGRFHLYYAVFDGSTWQVEMVDQPELARGVFSSLALDADDNPHIVYREQWTWHIYYAYKDATGWHTELLHEAPYPASSYDDGSSYTTIEFDHQNRPHALFRSYVSADIQPLIHAWHDGTAWQFETLDGNGIMGYQSSLAFDSQGYMHISYSDHTTEDVCIIHYAYQDAVGWHNEILEDGLKDTAANHGSSTLALTAGGLPVIAYDYNNGVDYTARVASRQSDGSWIKEDPYTSVYEWYPSMVLDAGGYPHLVHSGKINGYSATAIHTYKDSQGWHSTQIDPVNDNAYITSLAQNAAGDLFLYNQTVLNYRLNYASLTFGSSAWVTGTLGEIGMSGVENSLVLDANDRPHLASVDQYSHNGDIRYAYWDGAAWQAEWVELDGYSGYFGQPNPSLALDAEQDVHMAFYNDTGLAYGYRDALGWHTENVPSVGVEDHSSAALAIGADGYPRIAHSLDNASLAYSYLDGGGWHTDILTNTGAAAVDMMLDADGYAHISYVSGGLRYAYEDITGWHFEKVETTLANAALYATSLALGADGSPHIASGSGQTAGYSYPIVYSYKEEDTWVSYEVEHHGAAYPALTLDSQGHPHISYQTGRTGSGPDYTSDIRYAYQDDGGWHYQTLLTVVPGRFYFPYTDIALDSQERPYISFAHYNTLALMSYTAPLDSEPPTLPNAPGSDSPLITPIQDVVVNTPRPFFDWTDGEDNTGVVSYTLVVTAESGQVMQPAQVNAYQFTTTMSEYTPSSDLPAGNYSWTVQAHDAFGNDSAWAAAQQFSISSQVHIFLPLTLR